MKENKCNGCLLSPAGSHGSIAGSRAIRQWEKKRHRMGGAGSLTWNHIREKAEAEAEWCLGTEAEE